MRLTSLASSVMSSCLRRILTYTQRLAVSVLKMIIRHRVIELQCTVIFLLLISQIDMSLRPLTLPETASRLFCSYFR